MIENNNHSEQQHLASKINSTHTTVGTNYGAISNVRINISQNELPEHLEKLLLTYLELPQDVHFYPVPPLHAYELWLYPMSISTALSLCLLLTGIIFNMVGVWSAAISLYPLALVSLLVGFFSVIPVFIISKRREQQFSSSNWRHGVFQGTDFIMIRLAPLWLPVNKVTVIPQLGFTGGVKRDTSWSPFRIFLSVFGSPWVLILWSITYLFSNNHLPVPIQSFSKETYLFVEYEYLSGRRGIYYATQNRIGKEGMAAIQEYVGNVKEAIFGD